MTRYPMGEQGLTAIRDLFRVQKRPPGSFRIPTRVGLRECRDDLLPVGLQGFLLGIVHEVDGELVDAQVA